MATPTRRSVRSAALKRPLFSPIRGADAATSSASASSSATSVRAAIGESSSSTQLAQRIFSPTRRVQLRARRGQQNQQSHNASPNARSSPILLRAAKCKASPAKGRHTAAAAKAQTAPVASSAAAAKSKPKPKPKQYEVECIRAIRRVGGGSQSGEREYLLKWRGYAESENTWEPLSSLGSSCMSLLREFEASKQRKQHGGGDKPNGGHRDVEDDACVNPWREEEISALFQSYAHTAPTTKGFWSHVAQCTYAPCLYFSRFVICAHARNRM